MRPPILLLHGLGGCSFDWEHVVPHLGGVVVAPDAPAHGGRPAPPELTFEVMAEAALRAADARGAEQFIVAGISMGAATAATLAATRPGRVLGALYVAPAWLREPEPANLRRLQKLGRILGDHGTERAWGIVRALPPVLGWDAADVRALQDRYRAYDRRAVARALVELPRSLPRWPVAGAIPAHVMTWRNDPIHPTALAQAVGAIVGASVDAVDRPRKRGDEALIVAAAMHSLVRAVRAGTGASPAPRRHHA